MKGMCTVVMEQNTLYTQATGGVERLDFLKDNVVLYMYPHRNTISFKIVHPEINNKNVRP